MSVRTKNAYGQISITDEAVAVVAGHISMECYGVVEMVSRRFTDTLSELFHKQSVSKGIKISTINDRIYIDIYVVLRHGLSIAAVTESLRKSVKYGVENFTGMVVARVNISVVGVRL